MDAPTKRGWFPWLDMGERRSMTIKDITVNIDTLHVHLGGDDDCCDDDDCENDHKACCQ